MNKYMLVALIALLSLPLHSEEISLSPSSHALTFNEVWKTMSPVSSRIAYEPKKKAVSIYYKHSLITYALYLKESQVAELISAIDKYKKWNDKAISKKVTLNKVIAEIDGVKVYWQIGDGEWHVSTKSTATTKFFSQSEKRHQFLIQMGRVREVGSRFGETPDNLYFDLEGAIKFKHSISQKNIKKSLLENEKQKDLESDFN